MKRAYETRCGRDVEDGVEKLKVIFDRFARAHGALTRGNSVNAQEFRSILASLVRPVLRCRRLLDGAAPH